MNIFNLKFDFWAIKFPIYLPITYGLLLYAFPGYENYVAFGTLLLLAEPHFGATWPFLINKLNTQKFIKEKINYIYGPLLIIFISTVLFFYFNYFLLLVFFIANVFHVTKQSVGISKLFIKSIDEQIFQKYIIYSFNILFFAIGFFRFYTDIINQEFFLIINLTAIVLIFLSVLSYLYKYKYNKDIFIMLTGILIFYPMCFVDKPIHGILMGVTMHYSQYIALTYKISKKRKDDILQKNIKYDSKFILFIFFYGGIMTLLSISNQLNNEMLGILIFIPLLGQLLHFYLDSFLWRFSDEHHRNASLKFLKQ